LRVLRLLSIPGLGSFSLVLVLLNLPSVAAADSIELDGLIEPYLIVKVGSPVPGILESVKVDRGALVRKGQALATLQSGVEKATMELARARAEMESTIKAREARLKFSQRKQQRMEELYNKKVIPFEEMDESRTNSEMSLMDLEEAKDNQRLAELELKRSIEVVKRMTIYSPITGVVVERFLSAGEHVEDQPILQLAQINPLNVEVFAPVELLGTIKVGMHAKVTPEKPMGSVYKARVKIVDRVVDAASGTFGVRLQLPNPKYRLPAGLKCKVTFLKK
jgi:RND family efflux transporter MFP subunit